MFEGFDRVIVENTATGEVLAVMTDEEIDTASDDIVVRMRPRHNDKQGIDLSGIRTCDLVAELRKRPGAYSEQFGPYEGFHVEGEGPVIVLVVAD